MKKVGFIIGSGYQLISMLDLAVTTHKDDFKVAYFLNHYKRSELIYKNVREIGVFDKVYYLHDREYIITNRDKFKQTFFSKKWINKHIRDYDYEGDFDVIYGGGMTELVSPLYQVAKSRNSACQYYEVDDGGGFGVNFNDHYTLKSKVLCKILNRHLVSKELCGLFMFEKERYCAESLVPLYELPSIKENGKMKEILNKIYGITVDKIRDFNSASIIYLMSSENSSADFDRIKKEKEIVQVLQEALGVDIYIKLHPGKEDGNQLIDAQIPMEIFGLNCNLDEKVIISIFSTGAHASRVLFGSHPKTVFIYKMFIEEMGIEWIKKVDKAVKKYKELYNCEGTVFEPENLEECINVMRDILY